MPKLAILALAAAALMVTACNTVEGAGKDMQKAGTVVEKTAKDAK